MKVLYIQSGDDKYGSPKSLMELVLSLKNRYDVEPIVLTQKEGKTNELCNQNNIKSYVIDFPAFLIVGGSNIYRKIIKHVLYPYYWLKYRIKLSKAKKKILSLLENEKIDIVHTNINRIDIGNYYCSMKKIPHIMHIREFSKEDYNCMTLNPSYIDYLNKTTDKFVAISNAVKQNWTKKGLENNKIKTIYNGIDLSKYKTIPLRINENNDKIKIVFVGIVSETKGQIFLIKAIETLPDSIKNNIVVDFYGGGRKEYIKKLQRYVQKKGLSNIISFKGYCSDIPNILTDYDIGVVASRAEAFGRVTVEYMKAGLCVIASDTGANTEIVNDNENGLIFKYGDFNMLGNKIEYLIENKDTLRQIRETAYSLVDNKYSIDLCADNIFKLYKEEMEEFYDRNRNTI